MRLRLSTIFLFLFFGNISPVFAQNPNFIFEKLPSEIDWTDEAINDILQDYKGFIWMATWSGLKKYDGYAVKTYSQELDMQNGLNGNKIKCLFEDSKNRLWVGTNYTGFYLYDRNLDKFIQYKRDSKNMNSLSNNHVLAIHEDKEGFIWIGTENGLNRFSPDTETFVQFENTEINEKSKGYKGIVSFALSEEGNLWVGCEVGLDLLVKGKNGAPDYFVKYYLAPDNASDDDFLRHNFIHKIVPSKIEPNTLWIGTSIGVKKVKYFPEDKSRMEIETFGHQKKTNKGLSHSFVSDIYEDKKRNQLWIGTYNGINLMDIESGQFQYFIHDKFIQNSINNNVIHSLYKDKSDVLWIGTDKGINYVNFSSKPFRSIQFSESEQNLDLISSIKLSENKEGIWIATNGTGLCFIPMEGQSLGQEILLHYPIKAQLKADLSGFISDLIVSQTGDIWLTTKGAGLLKIPKINIPNNSSVIKNPIQYTMEEQLEDDYLMTLLQSTNGAIWIGYWDNGIGRLNPEKEEVIHFDFTEASELNLKKFPIVHFAETVEEGEKILWAGSRGGGLYKLKFDASSQELELITLYQFKQRNEKGISNNFINGIYQPKNSAVQNELWIGTENGLNILDIENETFSYINKSDGLKSHKIQSMLEDETGDIWVSTAYGISRIQRNGKSVEINNFDKYDGLTSDLFYDKSSAMLEGGQLIFGGTNGLIFFSPKEIQMDDQPPKVAIVDFRLFNESVLIGKLENGRTILKQNISETKEINLTHLDNVLSFEFVGLLASEPQKLKFAYKLEGFNEDWVYTDASERIAHFTNLPYESFQFKVKVANADGVWSEPVALRLNVTPPFWMTNWAYLIYFMVGSALLYGILRVVKMRSEFNHSLQLEKVEREKLEEVNKMKLQFFTNISHELRTPLSLIISPLEQFIKELSFDKKIHKSLVRMHQNANRLLTMINQLLDIRKSEAGLMKLKVAEGNFIKFSNEIVLSFKGLAKQRNIKLKLHGKMKPILVWYDRDQMEKVWFNLLSNALKFTPEGGKIDIHLFENDDSNLLTIKVMDNGAGIPKNQRAHIFDRFYQVEKNTEDFQKGGTGIGLALTKSIVEAHHGKIWVEDNEQGGSTFIFTMQQGDQHFSKEEKIIGFQNSEKISNYIMPNGTATISLLAKKVDAKIATKKDKPLVLLVEDNADIRSYLNENLEADYQIIQAKNGEEGLEKSLAKIPDIIIADISMPKMDGLQMCQKVKSELTTSHIPIILLTARTSLIFKIDGMENGADDYITKPFNMQLLKTRVRNLIDSRIQLKEKFAKNFDLSPSGIVMNSLDEQLLSQIKIVIEKNIDNSGFSVEQLASSLHLSKMQLYRKLKALTGKSSNKIIREIRLQRAAQLLETKQYNVADVTYMVGYNDLKYFRDQFKKEFGVSPSEYRKK